MNKLKINNAILVNLKDKMKTLTKQNWEIKSKSKVMYYNNKINKRSYLNLTYNTLNYYFYMCISRINSFYYNELEKYEFFN